MNKRLQKLKATLKELELDGLLVSHQPNIRYLCGFPAEESWLLIGRQKAFYITDSRYTLQAKRSVKGIPIVEYGRSFYESLFDLVKKARMKRLGFEESYCTVRQFSQLKKNCPSGFRLLGVEHIVEKLRECKDESELASIKKALRVHEASFRYLKKLLRPGLSELEVSLKLERFVKSRGCGFSFEPIVASGPNSCFPHAHVTKRVIARNDVVLVDWGIDYNGYKSDLTRMFFLGKIPKLVRTVNDTVIAAQKKAIEHIRSNVPIAQVDYQARNYLQKHKLAKFFGHSLGHGVGLEIHEAPRVSQYNKARLREGMVITVEPAVYIPNRFGIRIEDMVFVTKKGAQVLSGHIY